jgi:putative transposase
MAARFGFSEDTVRLAAAAPALASRGVHEQVYVDNGSAFVDSWLLRACIASASSWCIRRPVSPGTGQDRAVLPDRRDQFLAEVTEERRRDHRPGQPTGFHRLGKTVYTSARTPRPGRRRCAAGRKTSRPAALPTPAQLARGVHVERVPHRHQDRHHLPAATPTVDELLTGRRVELVFDPFDRPISRSLRRRSFSPAAAFTIGRSIPRPGRAARQRQPPRPASTTWR